MISPVITNIAVNGDSLNMMSKKVLAHLDKKNDYDLVVLAGGLADVAFSAFLDMGPMYKFAHRVQTLKGMQPYKSAAEFKSAYSEIITECRKRCGAPILLVTLNCAGEVMNNQYNVTRKGYNEAIRALANERDILLADAGIKIDEYLEKNGGGTYFLGSFWKLTYTDPIFTTTDSGCDWLSRRRGLKVTIDGIHLNSIAARLFSEAILNAIKRAQG